MSDLADRTLHRLNGLTKQLNGDPDWHHRLQRTLDPQDGARAHLAVMHQPSVRLVVDGRKTVESRFGKMRAAPYGQVAAGDVLLLKHLSGPVVALAEVRHVDFYVLDPEVWRMVRDRFAAALAAEDPQFWDQRRHARYATLMRLGATRTIAPLDIGKRDRRGWVVLDPHAAVHRHQLELHAPPAPLPAAPAPIWVEQEVPVVHEELPEAQLRLPLGDLRP